MFPLQLLKNNILKKAMTSSVEEAFDSSAGQYDRTLYIIKVLKADPVLQRQIRDVAVTSNNPGQQQLVAILTVFATLSPAKKAQYIVAFKACASLHGGATPSIGLQTAWEPGHIPPVFVP